MRLSRTVTVEHRTEGTLDVYGDPVTTTTSTVTVLGELQQLDRYEYTEDRNTQRADWLLLLPAGTTIDGTDRVTVDGTTFEVVGPPEPVWHPWKQRVDHVEARVRRTDG